MCLSRRQPILDDLMKNEIEKRSAIGKERNENGKSKGNERIERTP